MKTSWLTPEAKKLSDELAAWVTEFLSTQEDAPGLDSNRSLSRSITPHVSALSQTFNRMEGSRSIDDYWKSSRHPENLRWAYFCTFSIFNAIRVAGILEEIQRFGFKMGPSGKTATGERPLQAIDFGSGLGAVGLGMALFAKLEQTLGRTDPWLKSLQSLAMIEKDSKSLKLSEDWLRFAFQKNSLPWETRPFHRRLDTEGKYPTLLPPRAPKFDLWFSSYFLNEIWNAEDPKSLEASARAHLEAWDKHLHDQGIIVLIEPALKMSSRVLLEFRKVLLQQPEFSRHYQILLPCLGHQACGALENPKDWCHDEVKWWRPEYIRKIDEITELDHKTLPMSYLVIQKRSQPLEHDTSVHRIVSAVYEEGQDYVFYTCGKDGKKKTRLNGKTIARSATPEAVPMRGTVLHGADIRGDVHASRIEKVDELFQADSEK